MGAHIIQYSKESTGVVLEINESSNYNFQVYYKNIQIHDINIQLNEGQFLWISWKDSWEDKIFEIYSNGVKIKKYHLLGKRNLQKKILENYDINFIEKL